MEDKRDYKEKTDELNIDNENTKFSITAYLLISTHLFALIWISITYGFAAYYLITYGVYDPLLELSKLAMTTILGTVFIKAGANIFEHNDGAVFGVSDKLQETVSGVANVATNFFNDTGCDDKEVETKVKTNNNKNTPMGY